MDLAAVDRVGEAERERAVSRLRDAYMRGELRLDEFSEAVGAVYAATTSGDLEDAARVVDARPAPVDATAFAEHLLPGEHVYWTGAPDPSKHFNAADWFAVPF